MYTPFFSDFIHHVSSPTYKRSHLPSESEEAYSLRLASELESKILELGPENIMAFVAEPVVGAALGVMPPPKGYFPAINAVVRKHNLLFVMDEVMSGSGRVGELFAHDAVAEGVTPDIMAMAKGLGAGYVTISAVLVNSKVAEMVREAGQWKNSHTYQNHPVNCAVAKKVMEITEREGLMENVKARGAQLLDELNVALEGVKGVYDVRGKGLVSACASARPASTTSPTRTELEAVASRQVAVASR
jgi:adenosylmethionine-8-amino-7-oxononanoate aminotransferase